MAHLTPAQRRFIRKKTRVEHLDPSEMAGELNIVPLLDIIMNLIIFMLATMTAALMVMMIQTETPSIGRGPSTGQPPQPTLNLSITVVDEGVIVTGSGAKLAPGCERTGDGRIITVPRSGGEYDWNNLTECLSKVKERYPDESQVIISADPLIHYEHVIAAMDASRSKGADVLFPDVMLSAGVR